MMVTDKPDGSVHGCPNERAESLLGVGPPERMKGDFMKIKELLPVLALGVLPVLVVPLLAIIIFKDHLYWAAAVGLVVGIVLAFALVSALFAYHEILTDEEKERCEHEVKVRDAVKQGDALEIAVVNMQKLDSYYSLNRSQARNSFIASVSAVCVGFIAILIAARFSTDSTQALSGALGGILLNFIGGGFFVMYNKSLQQLNIFYGKLIQLQDTMLAVQQCDKLPPDKVADVRQSIILELITRPLQIQDGAGTPKSASARGMQLLSKRRRQASSPATQPSDGSRAGTQESRAIV